MLEEYLQLLQSIAFELDRAMSAISRNSIGALEESLANQEAFSTRLVELADDLSRPSRPDSSATSPPVDEDTLRQIRAASDSLQVLNRRYAALLKFSSRSVALMVSLFSSYQGQIREGSGPRLKLPNLVLPDLIAMSGLNTSLLIGMQALDVAESVLNATSNNIANANTPGYTREVPQVSENAETFSGGAVSGGGVSLTGLQSVRDELLNLQIQQQTSAQSSEDAQSSALASDSELFRKLRQRYCQRILRILQQSRAALRQSLQFFGATERAFCRPESGTGVQYHGKRIDGRAIGDEFASHPDGCANQLLDRADCATERPGLSVERRRQRRRHRRGSARRTGSASCRS